MAINTYRLMDMSLYYYLEGKFSPIGVEVGEGFLDIEDFNGDSPEVRFDIENVYIQPIELGNRSGQIIRTYTIYIYAKTKKQRDDIIYELLGCSEDRVPVYNYNEGFPPSATPTSIGCLIPTLFDVDAITYKRQDDTSKYLYGAVAKLEFKFDRSCG